VPSLAADQQPGEEAGSGFLVGPRPAVLDVGGPRTDYRDSRLGTGWLRKTRDMASAAALQPSAQQLRTICYLSELELAMRGLHQTRGWLSRPRRIFPFLGRKPT
jgi:hypothetical protein